MLSSEEFWEEAVRPGGHAGAEQGERGRVLQEARDRAILDSIDWDNWDDDWCGSEDEDDKVVPDAHLASDEGRAPGEDDTASSHGRDSGTEDTYSDCIDGSQGSQDPRASPDFSEEEEDSTIAEPLAQRPRQD